MLAEYLPTLLFLIVATGIGNLGHYGDALPPILITENGCAYDEPAADSRRIAYLESHLRALHRAMDAGADVRGYFTWSLTDNIEWTEGAAQRFGLVHIDYETLRRTPKESYAWYRDVIRAQHAAGRTALLDTSGPSDRQSAL